MLDGIHATKPMITYPGFRDQPIISNILLREKVGKLLKTFTYANLETVLDEMLVETIYSEMLARLQMIKNEQYKLGGYQTAVRVIEQVAEGKIIINRTMSPEDMFGIALYEVIAVCTSMATLFVFAIVGITLCCWQLCQNRTDQSGFKINKKIIKNDWKIHHVQWKPVYVKLRHLQIRIKWISLYSGTMCPKWGFIIYDKKMVRLTEKRWIEPTLSFWLMPCNEKSIHDECFLERCVLKTEGENRIFVLTKIHRLINWHSGRI